MSPSPNSVLTWRREKNAMSICIQILSSKHPDGQLLHRGSAFGAVLITTTIFTISLLYEYASMKGSLMMR